MKQAFLVIFLFAAAAQLFSQHQMAAPANSKPATLNPGLGNLHHPVTTKIPLAQKFFDQGLTLIYAFNHGEAIRSFERAAALDPQLAMAHWGIALATGPNYNEPDIDVNREKKAYDEMQKAISLQAIASEAERDYIQTLSKRFSNDPKADQKKLAAEYRSASKALMQKYPEDLDAAILYVESIMTPNAWKLFKSDGKPGEGTEEAISILEWVLRRDVNNIAANHYYIHATEMSENPERAIPSADRLGRLVPAAGHLVHMPAHTYEQVGEYAKAEQVNRAAVVVDESLFQKQPDQGMYKIMYYHHNVHFISFAAATQGRYAVARQNAEKLYTDVEPVVKDVPFAEMFLAARIYVPVQFQKWTEVLTIPQPIASAKFTTALWHWGRAIAFSATGKQTNAANEAKLFADGTKGFTADYYAGFNKASDLAAVAQHVLDAHVALTKQDRKSAIESLRKAVAAEDALAYDEPADWFFPVRPALGGLLALEKQNKEAEKIFREDLDRHPRNGRSLFGLLQVLNAEGRSSEAAFVQSELKEAWKNADTKLQLSGL